MTKKEVGTIIDKLICLPIDLKTKRDGLLGYIWSCRDNQVLIGHVLEVIFRSEQTGLLPLWDKCGLTKSLQEIVEASGWGLDCANCDSCGVGMDELCEDGCENKSAEEYRLKDPKAIALFEFLNKIL